MAAATETMRSSSSAQLAVKLAFEFLVLTAARSAEVRLATWTESNTTERVWTISAMRMKAKREHRVPLCGRALEVLAAARALGDGNRLVFPMRSGKAISASTLPKMLQQHRVAAVAHGFRSWFRDWAAEETDHPREVIEAALAHVVQNQVEAAYARSDLFARRGLLNGRLGSLRQPPARVRCNGFVKRSAGPPGSRPGRLPRKAKVTTRGDLGIPATFVFSSRFPLVDPIPWIASMDSTCRRPTRTKTHIHRVSIY